VAGDGVEGQPGLAGQHPEDRHRGGQDGRLAVLGQGQVVLGPLEAQLRDREAQGGVGLVVGATGDVELVGQIAAHTDPLRALAREQEGG
jgi:hypothetical protein